MVEVKSCGFLIFRNAPSPTFLLMKHPKRWDLPKGHVDDGETEMQCALRELEEETGIRKKDIEVDDEFRFVLQYEVKYKRDGTPKQKQLIIFLAELIKDVEIELTEHTGYQWFDWLPPHDIQEKTINPLLRELEDYWQ